MRKMVLGMAFAGAAVAVALVVPAAAAQGPDKGWYEECYGEDGPTLEEAEGGCIKVEGGKWQPRNGSDVTSGPSAVFGGFLFFAILLALVPAFIGAALASSAKIPGIAGFGIGLVGSWVGVIGLYLYGHSQSRTSTVIQTGPAVERTARDTSSAAERLRTLQDLLDQGLITEEEYRARRQAAVDSL